MQRCLATLCPGLCTCGMAWAPLSLLLVLSLPIDIWKDLEGLAGRTSQLFISLSDYLHVSSLYLLVSSNHRPLCCHTLAKLGYMHQLQLLLWTKICFLSCYTLSQGFFFWICLSVQHFWSFFFPLSLFFYDKCYLRKTTPISVLGIKLTNKWIIIFWNAAFSGQVWMWGLATRLCMTQEEGVTH